MFLIWSRGFATPTMSIRNFDFYNPVKLIVKEDASPEIAKYIAEDGHKSVLLA